MTLEDLLGHPEDSVRAAAAKVAGYAGELRAGRISREDFDALCAGATDLAAIDTAATTMTRQEEIAEALRILAGIAQVLPVK